MNPAAENAMNLLRCVREQADAIGVAVSFGKDSMATLDLCAHVFSRLEGYYLFRVRNMEIVEGWCADAKRRWGITIRQYPHFDLSRCYRHAVLQPHWQGLKDTPKIEQADIERQFRRDAAVEWIAYGWRRNDSFSRAMCLKSWRGLDPENRRVYPLRIWRRQDVYDYLTWRNIPLPEGFGRKDQGGLDFHPDAIKALSPTDRALWFQDFPFAEKQLLGTPIDQADPIV